MSINSTNNNYFEILKDSNSSFASLPGPDFHKSYPQIKECNCHMMPRGKRYTFENELISQIKEKYSNKNAPLKLVSFGAGGCLEELVILARLLAEGYCNIQISVVDPSFTKDNQALAQFKACVQDVLLAANPNAKVEITSASSVEQYYQKVEGKELPSPDVLLMVDLQGDTLTNPVTQNNERVLDYCMSFLTQKKINSLNIMHSLLAFTNYKEIEDSKGQKRDITVLNFLPAGIITPFKRLTVPSGQNETLNKLIESSPHPLTVDRVIGKVDSKYSYVLSIP